MATPDDGRPTRLQAFLSRAGVASRRKCELLIAEGRVEVNGEIVTAMGTSVRPDDRVRVDGKSVWQPSVRLYIAMNKPSGCVCSASDPDGRPIVFDYLDDRFRSRRLFTVGRLDMYSSGLILLTDDGDFAAVLGHPSGNVEKEYRLVSGTPVPAELVERFLSGLDIDGTVYKAKKVERVRDTETLITLIEGKNREIRNVFAHFGVSIVSLRRIRIGAVQLGSLEEGEVRDLTDQEISGFLSGRRKGA